MTIPMIDALHPNGIQAREQRPLHLHAGAARPANLKGDDKRTVRVARQDTAGAVFPRF